MDGLLDALFGDAGETCDVHHLRHTVDILEAGDGVVLRLAADTGAAEHVAYAVAGKGAALEHCDDDLVNAAGKHLVPQHRAGLIGGVGYVAFQLFLGDELVEAGIGIEVHAFAAPGLTTDAAGLGAGEDLHGSNAPHLFKIGLVAAVVRAGAHKALQVEKILGQKFAVFFFAFALGHQVAKDHLGRHAHDLFLQALAAALHACKALTYIVEHAAQAEEVLEAFLHAKLEALLVALLEAHLHGFLYGGVDIVIELFMDIVWL